MLGCPACAGAAPAEERAAGWAAHPLVGGLLLVVAVAAPEHLAAAGRDHAAAPPVVLAPVLPDAPVPPRLRSLLLLLLGWCSSALQAAGAAARLAAPAGRPAWRLGGWRLLRGRAIPRPRGGCCLCLHMSGPFSFLVACKRCQQGDCTQSVFGAKSAVAPLLGPGSQMPLARRQHRQATSR